MAARRGEETVTTPTPANSTAVQPFAKPTVPGAKVALGNKVPGLLQSTDPAERARQVQRGIGSTGKDPFSSVPPIVSFRVPVAPLPGTGSTGSTPTQTGMGNKPAVESRPIATKPNTTPISKPPEKSPIQSLPPLPDPTIAKAVQVTGVIVIGGVPQAILQAPNEATSRYVQVGQRISNGQVLVKRIEINNGSDPIVILEQNGVEVARAVGSPATVPTAMMVRSNLFA